MGGDFGCRVAVSPRNPDPTNDDPEPRRGRQREQAWRCLVATRRSSGSRSSVAPAGGLRSTKLVVRSRFHLPWGSRRQAMNLRRSATGKPRAGAIPSPSRNETAAEPTTELERATPTFHHPSLAFPGKMKQPSLVGRSLRTSSSDQVPSVASSESSHDCRAARAGLQWSGNSRILAPASRRQVPGSILAAIREDP